MTLTAKTMDWLNQNRNRAYPMKREEWRKKAAPGSGLDGVLMDALLFDSDGSERLLVTKVSVSSGRSSVGFRYGTVDFSIPLSGGTGSGEFSYEMTIGRVLMPGRAVTVSLALSSHQYLLKTLGVGEWLLNCPVMESRIVGPSDGFGVDAVHVNGSEGEPSHDSAASVSGDVTLEDGYRTSPVIRDGRVRVRVGTGYGMNPCRHDFGDVRARDCAESLMFFCGQNAINSGNVVLKGDKGVSITQGRDYAVKTGSCAGKTIPCVEIVATSELLELYRPEDPSDSSS